MNQLKTIAFPLLCGRIWPIVTLCCHYTCQHQPLKLINEGKAKPPKLTIHTCITHMHARARIHSYVKKRQTKQILILPVWHAETDKLHIHTQKQSHHQHDARCHTVAHAYTHRALLLENVAALSIPDSSSLPTCEKWIEWKFTWLVSQSSSALSLA